MAGMRKEPAEPKGGSRRPPYRPSGEWRPAFLAALRGSGNIRESCARAGIARHVAYDLRDADPVFAAEWKAALDDAVDELESAARARALHTSDNLLIFLLKAHRPEKYRESSRVEMSGPGGGPVETHDVVEWRPDAAWMRDYARIAQEVGADADDTDADPADEVQPA